MLTKLNYFWRLFSTGFCFTLFGLGSLFLGLVVIPIILYFPWGDKENKRFVIRHLISFNFNCFFWIMHYMGILRYKIIGRELIQNDKSCLIIANHPTLVDVISLISLYPSACCIVKRQLWSNFFMRNVVGGAGYIPNDDPAVLLESCKRSLDRGDVLIIFPEGTRTNPGQKMVLQRGAAHIALRLKCPMRMIQIHVNPPTLTKNLSWYKIPPRRWDYTVTIKELVDVDQYLEHETPLSLASRRLTKKIEQNIEVVSPVCSV